jgi:septal ring factor EnvC (AmiA/AmiB activator)
MTTCTLGRTVLLSMTVAVSGLAQGQAQNLQQLKAKLQQVEDQLQKLTQVTRELRNEIAAVEAAITSSLAFVLFLVCF